MPVYRYRTQGPAISDLSREVPGALTLSAAGFFYMDITAVAGSKADLDDSMAARGWLYVSQDPTNTPADEAATQGSDAVNVYDEGVLIAKQPTINFIGAGVSAVNNGGATRIDVTIPGGTSPTSSAPVNVNAAVAAVGVATDAARSDHKHSIDTATAVDVGTANSAGSGNNLALANHVHNVPFSAVNTALGAASASVSVNNQKITNLLDPTAAQEAATKAYVDATAQGLDVKASCRFATAAALPAYTASGAGVTKILTANANGVLTVDGTPPVLNDRILVKDQGATHADHGIYTLTQVGTAGLPFILTRAVDANTSAKVTTGLYTFIEAGSANVSSGWTLTTAMPITLDTTLLGFSQFSGAGQIVAGAGLTKTGNTLNVIANADGSITVNADDIQVGVISDTQHGTRGGGTQHANVIAAGAAGFMTGADKTKLDGIPAIPATECLTWGNSGVATTTTARFLTPGYDNTSALVAPIQFRVPRAGTIQNLRVHHNTAGTGANAIVYTVRKNSTNQTLTCSMLATATDGSDLVHTFTVAAGDLLDITATKALAITTTPAGITATVEYAA